jgi:hypothetical protein
MENAMVCHVLEGELRIDQEGKIFTGKKKFHLELLRRYRAPSFESRSSLAMVGRTMVEYGFHID